MKMRKDGGRAAQRMLGAGLVENILGDWLEQLCQLMIFIGIDLKWGTQSPRSLFHVSCPTSDSSPVILALFRRCFIHSWLIQVGEPFRLLLITLLLYVQTRQEIIHVFLLLGCCCREQTAKAPWEFSKQQLCYFSWVGDERVTTVAISLWLLVLTDVSASRRCSLRQTNLLLIFIISIVRWQLRKVCLGIKLVWLRISPAEKSWSIWISIMVSAGLADRSEKLTWWS